LLNDRRSISIIIWQPRLSCLVAATPPILVAVFTLPAGAAGARSCAAAWWRCCRGADRPNLILTPEETAYILSLRDRPPSW